MHPNGDEVHKIYGDGYEIITKNKNVLISGVCNITIEGDSLLHVKGNRKELIDGDYSIVVKGDYTVTAQETASITSKDTVSLMGDTLSLRTPDVVITGNMVVDGALDAYTVSCATLTARAGVSCGLGDPGNPLKGQIPVLPTGIFSSTTITALLGVAAPLGTFGLMSSVLMTDTVNTALHNCHFHASFKGPTGPPIPKMI
jgi:urease alpha subunit